MQISKLLNGTVWASTDILKKTRILFASVSIFKSWAQATIIIY